MDTVVKDTVRVKITLDTDIHNRVAKLADSRGMPLATFLRMVIGDYIEARTNE